MSLNELFIGLCVWSVEGVCGKMFSLCFMYFLIGYFIIINTLILRSNAFEIRCHV